MAILHHGLHGHPSGSIGDVTFVRAAGGRCIARLRTTPANPRTPAQQRQRQRFKQMQQFAAACRAAGVLPAFWQGYATDGRTTHNAFVRAQSRAMPGSFDPSAARLSLGNGLAPVELASVARAASAPGRYVLRVESPAGGCPDDLLVGVLYHGGAGRVVMSDAGAPRGLGQVEVTVPVSWMEEEGALFAYAFAYRREGGMRLSESSARKVTEASFEVPAPHVPPARERAVPKAAEAASTPTGTPPPQSPAAATPVSATAAPDRPAAAPPPQSLTAAVPETPAPAPQPPARQALPPAPQRPAEEAPASPSAAPPGVPTTQAPDAPVDETREAPPARPPKGPAAPPPDIPSAETRDTPAASSPNVPAALRAAPGPRPAPPRSPTAARRPPRHPRSTTAPTTHTPTLPRARRKLSRRIPLQGRPAAATFPVDGTPKRIR